ncbi:unnamed protein product [Phytophthora lilii]|uniref:Unnamed protein product n=1 Tax=Phytophthora lilii TaxID=2077276 RepID=A0A9W6X960_9STRA|nr:unnamed protein product [Phytophthora lilii]
MTKRSFEQVVTAREEACSRLQEDLIQQKTLLEIDIHAHAENELKTAVRDFVNKVELSSKQALFQQTLEDFTWSNILSQAQRDCTTQLRQHQQETEALVAVKQQLLTDQLQHVRSQLSAGEQQLQDQLCISTHLEAFRRLVTARSGVQDWLADRAVRRQLGARELADAECARSWKLASGSAPRAACSASSPLARPATLRRNNVGN